MKIYHFDINQITVCNCGEEFDKSSQRHLTPTLTEMAKKFSITSHSLEKDILKDKAVFYTM